jgi:hypothetical protein
MMSTFDKPPRYRSYLLTVWEERSQDPDVSVIWRFSLQDPRTGQRRGFASLEEMVSFLRTKLVSHWDKRPD